MRIKVGPDWVEQGPGRAVTSNAGQAAVGGVPVGKMRPDVTTSGPMPKGVPGDLRHPNPLGIKGVRYTDQR